MVSPLTFKMKSKHLNKFTRPFMTWLLLHSFFFLFPTSLFSPSLLTLLQTILQQSELLAAPERDQALTYF